MSQKRPNLLRTTLSEGVPVEMRHFSREEYSPATKGACEHQQIPSFHFLHRAFRSGGQFFM
jgi:hypothetical protein